MSHDHFSLLLRPCQAKTLGQNIQAGLKHGHSTKQFKRQTFWGFSCVTASLNLLVCCVALTTCQDWNCESDLFLVLKDLEDFHKVDWNAQGSFPVSVVSVSLSSFLEPCLDIRLGSPLILSSFWLNFRIYDFFDLVWFVCWTCRQVMTETEPKHCVWAAGHKLSSLSHGVATLVFKAIRKNVWTRFLRRFDVNMCKKRGANEIQRWENERRNSLDQGHCSRALSWKTSVLNLMNSKSSNMVSSSSPFHDPCMGLRIVRQIALRCGEAKQESCSLPTWQRHA